MERDASTLTRCSRRANFNSHAHVERDGRCAAYLMIYEDFNSHAHVERDHMDIDLCGSVNISTHTLTWSVTEERCEDDHSEIFQLTRSRGA